MRDRYIEHQFLTKKLAKRRKEIPEEELAKELAEKLAQQKKQADASQKLAEWKARTPCKYYNGGKGHCPYGWSCHFLHNQKKLIM